MRKRITGLLLALCALAGLLPQLSVSAQAVDTLSAAPGAGVEYARSDSTPAGVIRFVSQLSFMNTFYEDYWGSYTAYAGHECYTACISMALSYTGVNATPAALGDYWLSKGYTGGVPFATTPEDVAAFGAVCSKLPLAEAMERYLNGRGKYSPPILHLDSYSANGHFVVLAGRISATEYLVLEPASDTVWTITIQNGRASYWHNGARSEMIEDVTQFYYADGGFGYHADGSVCPGETFYDLPGETHWSHAGIDYCVFNELMNGTGAHTFEPEQKMTRAMLIAVLYRMAGEPDVAETECPFTDLTQSWYRDAAAWAYDAKITTGVNDTQFAPGAKLTREQMVTMLWRFAQQETAEEAEEALQDYTDAARISDWARQAMAWAVDAEILHGVTDETLAPSSGALRGQVATILARYCEQAAAGPEA